MFVSYPIPPSAPPFCGALIVIPLILLLYLYNKRLSIIIKHFRACQAIF